MSSEDNKDEIIQCPACGKPMIKVYMPDQGVNLDVCINGCGGIFFDNREFDKFNEQHEDISPLEKVFENKSFNKVDDSYDRICPICGWKMVKNYSSSSHDVQIDECYGCGGKFLDYSELDKFRSQYATDKERSEDVLKELYKTAGIELDAYNTNYENRMKKTNVLYKLIVNHHLKF